MEKPNELDLQQVDDFLSIPHLLRDNELSGKIPLVLRSKSPLDGEDIVCLRLSDFTVVYEGFRITMKAQLKKEEK